jgi:glycoside/pentoside/hexuronide:cation symporter, GPH family
MASRTDSVAGLPPSSSAHEEEGKQGTGLLARKLPVSTKLAYGFGSIAYGIKDNGFSTFLLLFYNQVIGLRADMVGLAIMAALIFDAFVDPVVGHFSDHLRTRWGRRHPFMYAAALPVGILYWLLWNPPTGSDWHVLGWLFAIAVLVRTAISCYEVPSSALAPELTADYNERTAVLGYRYVFGWIGGMVMLLLTFGLFLAPTAQYPIGQLNPEGYASYAIVASIVMTLAILISALGTHREIQYLPKAPVERLGLTQTLAGIVSTLRNRAFLVLLLAGVFSFTAQGLNFALSVYLNTYFWEFPATSLALFTFGVIGAVMIAFAVATRASKTWGKRKTSVIVFTLYPFISAMPYALRYIGYFPENGSFWLMPALLVSTIIATSLGVCGAILGASMMSDVVEDSQVTTGKRSEGLFFAGSFFMQKCVSGLGLFLSGAILAFVGFPANASPETVTPEILWNLALIFKAALIILSLMSAFIISYFPLGGEKDHEERLARLAEIASHSAPLPGSEPEMPA